MLTSRVLTTFLNLQQIVLDSKDEKSLLKTIFNIVIAELSKVGLNYDLIGAIFFDNNGKIVSNYVTSKPDFDNLKLKPDFLKQNTKIQVKLYANEIAITESPQFFLEGADRNSTIKSVILSPIRITNSLIGVLLLASEKNQVNISNEEYELIEVFTNFLALAYRLQDTQSSLTSITQEVYKMNVRLHDLDKLKDDFVSMASHELRTPMTAIKSYLWMALNKRKAELSPQVTKYLSRAFHSTERLISLVNDMLNISRIESGRIALRLAEVDPLELVHDVVEEVIPKAGELQLNVKVVEKRVSKVLIDRDKIHEVIINLIGNSLKFTKPGGTISVTFDEKPPYIYVSVTDTGVGMAKEDMARLFKKFSMLEHSYTASSSTSGGTGLGLYISKSIVTLHKGTITAYSPGREKGSTFTISLPIVGTSTALELQKEAPKVSDDTKGLEKKKLTFL